jgi:competence protein ComEC
MRSLHHRPLIPVAVIYVVGILSASAWLALTAAAAALSFLLFASLRRSYAGFVVVLFGFLLLGSLRGYNAGLKAASDVSHHIGRGRLTVHGTVSGDVRVKNGFGREYVLTELAAHRYEFSTSPPTACTGLILLGIPANGSVPQYGDYLSVTGVLEEVHTERNPGGYDLRAHMQRRGVYAALHVRRTADWTLEAPGDRQGVVGLAHRIRMSIIGSLRRLLPASEASLAAGIVIGARAEIPAPLGDDFTATSTAHILAASGMNVGLVAILIYGSLRLMRVRRTHTAVVIVLLLPLYALICGGSPSIVRACLMASLFLLGRTLGREADGANALAAAALILLLISPLDLYDIGFQLSFVTVGTILAVMAAMKPWLDRLLPSRARRQSKMERTLVTCRHMAASALLVTIAAQIGAAPLVAQHFHQTSVIGPLANLLILPTLMLILAGGFCLWGLSFVWYGAASWFAATFLSPLLAYVIGAVTLSAGAQGAVVSVSSPGWVVITLSYALLGAMLTGLHRWATGSGAPTKGGIGSAQAGVGEVA